MVVTPAARPPFPRTHSPRTMRNTVCERLLCTFILVAPTCRFVSPSSKSRSTSSGLVTMSSRSPATYTPFSRLS